MTQPLRWSTAARSHPGRARRHNEDAFLCAPEKGLFVVADGMGGHDAGDVASAAIVSALAAIEKPENLSAGVSRVRSEIVKVNRDLLDIAAARGRSVIGSTVVAFVHFGDHGVVIWAGDSRMYRLRDGALEQLTRDHSRVQQLVDDGVIAPGDAHRHPAGNVVTRAVGVADDLELDSVMIEIAPGDTYLLCSDGLADELTDKDIQARMDAGDCDGTAELLLSQALANGGRDNISIVLAHAERDERTVMNPDVAEMTRPDQTVLR